MKDNLIDLGNGRDGPTTGPHRRTRDVVRMLYARSKILSLLHSPYEVHSDGCVDFVILSGFSTLSTLPARVWTSGAILDCRSHTHRKCSQGSMVESVLVLRR